MRVKTKNVGKKREKLLQERVHLINNDRGYRIDNRAKSAQNKNKHQNGPENTRNFYALQERDERIQSRRNYDGKKYGDQNIYRQIEGKNHGGKNQNTPQAPPTDFKSYIFFHCLKIQQTL